MPRLLNSDPYYRRRILLEASVLAAVSFLETKPMSSIIQQAAAHGAHHDLLLRAKPQLALYGVDGVSDRDGLHSPRLRNRGV